MSCKSGLILEDAEPLFVWFPLSLPNLSCAGSCKLSMSRIESRALRAPSPTCPAGMHHRQYRVILHMNLWCNKFPRIRRQNAQGRPAFVQQLVGKSAKVRELRWLHTFIWSICIQEPWYTSCQKCKAGSQGNVGERDRFSIVHFIQRPECFLETHFLQCSLCVDNLQEH